MRTAIVYALLAVCCRLSTAGECPPNARATAKASFEEGAKQYKLGRFAEAVKAFEASYELCPEPILLYNLGQTYRKLGDVDRALHAYNQYLTDDPVGKHRVEVDAQVSALRMLADEQRKSRQSPPTGTLSPDGETKVGAPSPPPPPPTVAPSQGTTNSAIPTSGLTVTDQPAPQRSRTWLWVTIGVVAAVVIAGVTVGLVVAFPEHNPAPSSSLGSFGVF